MLFQEPRVVFIGIELKDIISDSGAEIHGCSGSNFGDEDCYAPGKLLPNEDSGTPKTINNVNASHSSSKTSTTNGVTNGFFTPFDH